MRDLQDIENTRYEQLDNSAELYVSNSGRWTRLQRFLIVGSENGTYKVSERDLRLDNVSAVTECLRTDGLRVVHTILEIAASGRAPKQDPALFVLALASSPKFADPYTNAAALEALPHVARTGTQLCIFAGFVQNVRGWGRSLRSAVADWYLSKPASELADQMLKCGWSNGWSHRDLLRVSHPKAESPAHNALFQWAVDGRLGHLASRAVLDGELRLIRAFEEAKKARGEDEIVGLIEYDHLNCELIPPQWRNSACIWESLLETMPYMELLQQLGQLTAVGLLRPQSPAVALAVARIVDRARVLNSRVHPISLASALANYAGGEFGELKWPPVASIVGALDEAFYMSFDNVESFGQRVYVAIDASGSMQEPVCTGMPNMSPATASAVLAMMFARTQPACKIAAFHDEVSKVDIGRKDSFDWACEAIRHEPRDTNASLPIRDALDRGLAVDAFVILTDNEAWSGDEHPGKALAEYRRATGIAAKLVVIAMAASGDYSVIDRNDPLQMEVVGFDRTVPGVLADFLAH